MLQPSLLPVDRFLSTLEIVRREGERLAYSWRRLYAHPIDIDWIRRLKDEPEAAEQLEAFVSRFGRMQDTIADTLLPRWLLALGIAREYSLMLMRTYNRTRDDARQRLALPDVRLPSELSLPIQP
jgi:hypothetical protein